MSGVLIVTSFFYHDALSAAEDLGMPGLRMVTIPDLWYRARINPEMCKDLAQEAFPKVIDALTRPLTAEEANPPQKPKEELEQSFVVTADNYPAALDELHQLFMEKRMCDGLPIIPPTREAVDWMLTGTSRPPSETVGTFPPKKGTATIEKIAINAVMAGARPEHLPVIIAALEGLSDPEYDSTWWRMSTSSSFPVIICSGPIAEEIKMNCGMGLIGYGFRANATIGRAVQLTTMNMGYSWPAENDMASIGRLNSYTFYTFAENIEESPWESYAEEKGYGADGSVVLVATSSGGRLTIMGGGAVASWTEQTILDRIVEHIGQISGTSIVWTSFFTVVIHPQCAKQLADKGWSKRDVQEYLFEKSKVPFENLAAINVQHMRESLERQNFIPEAVPVFEEALQPGGMVPVVQTPDFIDIIVAGGEAGYTFVFGGPAPNPHHQVKLIRGSTLTKYGK